MKVVKALILGGILGAAGAVPASAQTIGFKIGPTFSKLDVEDDGGVEPETLTNFGGGGFIRFGLAGLSLQAEVLALTKGAKQSFDDGVNTLDGSLKFNYVEIPVTAMFSLGSGPYLFAGPSVAFEVSCEIEVDAEDIDFESECDDDEGTLDRKKTDFSLHGGAGFQFPVGPGHLLIEGRYIYGLSDLNDDDTQDSSSKHRTWAVFAGFAIPIGR